MLAAKKKGFSANKKKVVRKYNMGFGIFYKYLWKPSKSNKHKKKTEKANGLRRIFEMKKVHTKGKFQKSNYRKI